MKRLVLFVEGEGDAVAVPAMVKRLITERSAWSILHLDPHPFQVGEIHRLYKDKHGNWIRWLKAACKRPDVGAILLVLDGDIPSVYGRNFCTAKFARELAEASRAAGGGQAITVAVVFACQEYESWLIAGVESLAGKILKDGRPGIKEGTTAPSDNLEIALRGAKGWLRQNMHNGYSPVKDQAMLTELVDLEQIRKRPMRSFQRLESAIDQIVSAISNDTAIVSPM